MTKCRHYRIIAVPSLTGEAGRAHCYIEAVGSFPRELDSRGGEANVEKAFTRFVAAPAVFGMGAVAAHHKSVLAARLQPERLTLC